MKAIYVSTSLMIPDNTHAEVLHLNCNLYYTTLYWSVHIFLVPISLLSFLLCTCFSGDSTQWIHWSHIQDVNFFFFLQVIIERLLFLYYCCCCYPIVRDQWNMNILGSLIIFKFIKVWFLFRNIIVSTICKAQPCCLLLVYTLPNVLGVQLSLDSVESKVVPTYTFWTALGFQWFGIDNKILIWLSVFAMVYIYVSNLEVVKNTGKI